MNLYYVSRGGHIGYDEYDSAVVAAETEQIAATIHPDGSYYDEKTGFYGTWARPENVRVKLIGVAVDGTPQGVICASFNAG